MNDLRPGKHDVRDLGRLWAESFERSSLAIAIGDPQTNQILAVNQSFAAQRGFHPEELVGQSVAVLFPTDCRASALDQITRADQDGHVTFQTEHITKDGSRLPVLLDITVLRSPSDQPVARWVFAIDLVRQKRVEAELREEQRRLAESERRLRLAQGAANVGTWEWDLTTGRNHWTDEAYVLYGLEPGSCEPSYETWSQRVHPEDRERVAREVEAAASCGAELQVEWRVIDTDPPRWLLSRGQPQLDDHGRIVRYLGIVQDITANRLASEELRRSETRYRDMYLANPNPMWVFDAETLAFLDVNDSVIQQYGYSRDEFLRMSIKDIRPPEEVLRVDETVREVLGGRWRTGIWRHRRKDGTEMMMDVTAHEISYNGRPAVVVLANDITERLRAEEEIRALAATLERRVTERTAQLEQANRAKTDFLANMSHELRTPLNAVIGFSQVLKDGLAGDLTRQQESFATDIHEAGRHLLSLINDVLDLSKVEAGVQTLDLAATDVADLLRSTINIVRESAHAHGIRLEVETSVGVGIMQVDARKLRQIAFNLLSNAVKFTPDGGTVRLLARRCGRDGLQESADRPARVLPLPPGDWREFLEIAVSDTGPGIPADKLALLFEPFVQLDASSTRRHAGTGLGLALTRRLAELHGGTVGVTSDAGRGCCFRAWLPYRTA